uniref:Protein YIP n=1 Tax=Nelumbo nucifera TaxID=4432 RepID=A0A822YAK5_NELNU|nr:TPA_asm: hypothetical protein HUJ06_029787 [Nelumbo nucifera]
MMVHFGDSSYGLIWISATLVFLLASLGNCATYLIHKQTNHSTSWSFDVSYVSVAACTVYGYVLVVPTAFYFLLQYLGISASLVRFWCMWGYSLFIFIPTSVSHSYLLTVTSISFAFTLLIHESSINMYTVLKLQRLQNLKSKIYKHGKTQNFIQSSSSY